MIFFSTESNLPSRFHDEKQQYNPYNLYDNKRNNKKYIKIFIPIQHIKRDFYGRGYDPTPRFRLSGKTGEVYRN